MRCCQHYNANGADVMTAPASISNTTLFLLVFMMGRAGKETPHMLRCRERELLLHLLAALPTLLSYSVRCSFKHCFWVKKREARFTIVLSRRAAKQAFLCVTNTEKNLKGPVSRASTLALKCGELWRWRQQAPRRCGTVYGWRAGY